MPMVFEPDRIYHFDNEDAVWQFLEDLVVNRVPSKRIALDFSKADWAKLRLVYDGKVFRRSLPTSAMRGMIDLQNSYYRSVALLIKDSTRITRLTDEEKEKYEFVFKITAGSTDNEAEGKDGLIALAANAVQNMTSRDTLIAIAILALAYYGTDNLKTYMSHNVDLARIQVDAARDDHTHQEISALINENAAKDALLDRSLKQSEKATAVFNESLKGLESVVKSAARADNLAVQGTQVGRSVVEELNRGTRRQSENIIEVDTFTVAGVDTTSPNVFRVKLQSIGTDTYIMADLDDAIAYEKFHRVISRAEWNRRPIRVRFSARKLGDQYLDAKILSATGTRRRE